MGFIEKQTDPTTPMHWRGNMQADYFYPSGAAGDKFFKHLMQMDTFLATKCSKCNKILFPPRMYCEDCYQEITDDDWAEVPAAGTIRLFTVVMLDAHGEKLANPKVIALIDINKTNGAMLGVIKTDDINKDLSGIKVKAILKPRETREGTIKDILYWEEI
jgi:uncharacterized OB-fold protein